MKIKCTVIIPLYNQQDLVIKSLDSIPTRDDIEIIVIDDGSTDYSFESVRQYVEKHNEKNIVLLHNGINKGVGFTVNKGYDYSKGEYVVLLGSDDYFYKDQFEKCLDLLDGTDIVYFNLRINDQSIWYLNEQTKRQLCGSTKFIRREFIGESRNPLLKSGEDYHFYNELLAKNPTEKFSNLVVKHYNYPRKGSLTDIYSKKR